MLTRTSPCKVLVVNLAKNGCVAAKVSAIEGTRCAAGEKSVVVQKVSIPRVGVRLTRCANDDIAAITTSTCDTSVCDKSAIQACCSHNTIWSTAVTDGSSAGTD